MGERSERGIAQHLRVPKVNCVKQDTAEDRGEFLPFFRILQEILQPLDVAQTVVVERRVTITDFFPPR